MTWYRCRIVLGDGSYESYIGPDVATALDHMDGHPRARTVVVESLGYDNEWQTVAGIWR